MRYTYGTIAAVTCAILVLAAFWPGPQAPLIPQGIAQSGPAREKGDSSALGGEIAAVSKSDDMKSSDPFAGCREKIEAKLAEPCEAGYFQMPLREVLTDLSERLEITILFDPEELGKTIDPDVPIDVEVGPNTMSGKTLLGDFILAPKDLVYTIRDNFLLISSYDRSLTKWEIVAYDCRDLLAKSGGFVAPDTMTVPLENNNEPPIEGGDAPKEKAPFYFGGPNRGMLSAPQTPERQLLTVIQMAIRSEDSPWDDGSTPTDENVGTMSVIKGMLVVRQTRAVHEQIEQLLEILRKGIKERERSTTTTH